MGMPPASDQAPATRLRGEPGEGLLHPTRQDIYKLVREEPGIHAQAIGLRLGLGWGTTTYHLRQLERHGLLVARRQGRYKHFFANGDRSIQHKDAVGLLRNPTARAIAGAIGAQPNVVQKDLCLSLGISPSLASWHLRRLQEAGVVRAERVGRFVRYCPSASWSEIQAVAATAPPPSVAVAVPVGAAA